MASQCDWDISVEELQQLLEGGSSFRLIDVREQSEFDAGQIGGELIPLGSLPEAIPGFDPDSHIVIHCKSGGRSAHAVKLMRAQGFSNVWNVQGGLLAWAARIDASIVVG